MKAKLDPRILRVVTDAETGGLLWYKGSKYVEHQRLQVGAMSLGSFLVSHTLLTLTAFAWS